MVKGSKKNCVYCRREMVKGTDTHPTRDHIVPKSRGGKEMVWCCTKCNHAKGDMSPSEWQWFRLNFPMWWRFPGRIKNAVRAVAGRRKAHKTVPKMSDDPDMQRALENAYRGRAYLLTDTSDETPSL